MAVVLAGQATDSGGGVIVTLADAMCVPGSPPPVSVAVFVKVPGAVPAPTV